MNSRLQPVLPTLIALLLFSIPAFADSVFSTERQLIKLADGVYVIRHKDPFPRWVQSNTTVVIGDRQVLVVDSCQTLSAAAEDIEQIRKWTNKSVAFLLNTHWHQDHNGGNKSYVDAFPGISIVAHPETRSMMDRTSPNLSTEMIKQAQDLQATLKKRLETGKGKDDKPLTEQQKTTAREHLAEAESLIEQAKNFVYQPPNFLLVHEMTIDLGSRIVKVMHVGRGNTGGDIIAYLPQEKILVTGDLAVHPVPYAFDGYPSDWIKTLEALSQMNADTIVPGHGEILHDKAYLNLLAEMMKSVLAQVDAKMRANSEISLQDVQKTIDLNRFRQQFCGTDPQNCGFFDLSIGEKFVELAYHEAKAR